MYYATALRSAYLLASLIVSPVVVLLHVAQCVQQLTEGNLTNTDSSDYFLVGMRRKYFVHPFALPAVQLIALSRSLQFTWKWSHSSFYLIRSIREIRGLSTYL